MADIASDGDIIAELNKRGYKAKLDGTLIIFDINPEIGHCRTYTIERDRTSGDWQVNLSEVIFDDEGEDNEEQTIIGNYSSATDIADAIDEHEEEQ
jgi:hypothetical protein